LQHKLHSNRRGLHLSWITSENWVDDCCTNIMRIWQVASTGYCHLTELIAFDDEGQLWQMVVNQRMGAGAWWWVKGLSTEHIWQLEWGANLWFNNDVVRRNLLCEANFVWMDIWNRHRCNTRLGVWKTMTLTREKYCAQMWYKQNMWM
jgi:hypothetical protein